jgi:hypothetical protein
MCRGQCEKQRAIWDECIDDISLDSADKNDFDTQMADLTKLAVSANVYLQQGLPTSEPWNPFTFPDCDVAAAKTVGDLAIADVANAFFFAMWPGPAEKPAMFPQRTHLNFPEHMSTEAAFPVESSTWTHTDGVDYEVQCFVPDLEAKIAGIECPDPFMPSLNKEECVLPCPSPVYSLDEYTDMWAAASATAFIGFILNSFMAITWQIGTKKKFAAVPFQLRTCVGFGALYGIIHTLPMLALKHDLPCGECATEECTGISLPCTLNRMGIYMLLGILISLSALTFKLYSSLDMTRGGLKPRQVQMLDRACLLVPFVLLVIAYLFDSEDFDNDNGELNVVRHAFSCSMRFPTMVHEWACLWVHFLWSGSVIVFCTLKAYFAIASVQKSMKATNAGDERKQSVHNAENSRMSMTKKKPKSEMDHAKTRLMRIAAFVACLTLLNLSVTVQQSSSLQAWSENTVQWLTCFRETWASR